MHNLTKEMEKLIVISFGAGQGVGITSRLVIVEAE
jgi:hypothetical protein